MAVWTKERAREYHRIYKRKWTKANPEKAKAISRAYYLKHRKELCKKAREYQQAHPEQTKRLLRNWRRTNREKIRLHEQRRSLIRRQSSTYKENFKFYCRSWRKKRRLQESQF